ncbi:Trimeric LpxA-like protein [Cordyceps javanica]|uniref:Dynactin subunit 6 n=1 Tax=Cordyceps javanica TaxID=43265 RepID=A0A545UZM9_9HYPO|nr:Trimeric LpxA-like protein [Cordyceps javanica]
MSSKRHSILPAIDRSGPKPPVNFSSSLIISDNAILQGTHSITMQAETVIHPRCRFESNDGSVLIGRRCIIHERAHIGARPENPETAGAGGVAVGDYVQIEVGSIIESGGTEIGEGCLVQIGSKIGSGTKIGSVCLLTSLPSLRKFATTKYGTRTAQYPPCPLFHPAPHYLIILLSIRTARNEQTDAMHPI